MKPTPYEPGLVVSFLFCFVFFGMIGFSLVKSILEPQGIWFEERRPDSDKSDKKDHGAYEILRPIIRFLAKGNYLILAHLLLAVFSVFHMVIAPLVVVPWLWKTAKQAKTELVNLLRAMLKMNAAETVAASSERQGDAAETTGVRVVPGRDASLRKEKENILQRLDAIDAELTESEARAQMSGGPAFRGAAKR